MKYIIKNAKNNKSFIIDNVEILIPRSPQIDYVVYRNYQNATIIQFNDMPIIATDSDKAIYTYKCNGEFDAEKLIEILDLKIIYHPDKGKYEVKQ